MVKREEKKERGEIWEESGEEIEVGSEGEGMVCRIDILQARVYGHRRVSVLWR